MTCREVKYLELSVILFVQPFALLLPLRILLPEAGGTLGQRWFTTFFDMHRTGRLRFES